MTVPVLFSTDPSVVKSVAGRDPLRPDIETVGAVVVDWETDGKRDRQRRAVSILGTDTQISTDTLADLRRVTTSTDLPVWCRLNAWDRGGRADLERAIDAAADEVLLPMVRTPEVVDEAIRAAAGRASVGILIETADALDRLDEFSDLGMARAYVGLMDLGIERRRPLFAPFVDGTLERVATTLGSIPLGVGGLTGPNGGRPIPSRLLAGEIVRLGADFSFLRRSFLADHAADPRAGVRSIHDMLDTLRGRTPFEVEEDHRRFASFVPS